MNGEKIDEIIDAVLTALSVLAVAFIAVAFPWLLFSMGMSP